MMRLAQRLIGIALGCMLLSACGGNGGSSTSSLPLARGVDSDAAMSASDETQSADVRRRACSVHWSSSARYDSGVRPSIALNSLGFFVEEHKQEIAGNALYYHLGKFVAGTPEWGGSIRYDSGYDPSVAIRTDGLILDVHSNAGTHSYNPLLYYRIGKIDPHGNRDQTIHWFGDAVKYDGGFFPHVSINDHGRIVEAHESSSWPDNRELVYCIGHLVTEHSGYRIDWDSGDDGIEYDRGSDPQIALDNAGNVVEVHADGNDLHYHRGTVSGGRIVFPSSPSNGRYITGGGREPNIAITDSGLALETHTVPLQEGYIGYVLGRIDRHQTNVIHWTYHDRHVSSIGGRDSSAGTNGVDAIEVNTADGTGMNYSYGAVDCALP